MQLKKWIPCLVLSSITIYPMSIIKKPLDAFKDYAPEAYISYCKWGMVNTDDVYHAAAQGRATYLDALLKRGIDPNVLNQEEGKSPLSVAVDRDHYQVIKVLLRHKADVQLRDATHDTPLRKAFGKKQLFSAGLLLACNPNLSYRMFGSSVLQDIDEKYTFRPEEKTYLYDFIAKHCNLDAAIESAFELGQVGNLKGPIVAHKPTAEKVFLTALSKDHKPTIEVMLKKYQEQLNNIGQKLTVAHQKVLVEKYSNELHNFFSGFQVIPENLKDLKQSYECMLEPFYKQLHELDPKLTRMSNEYSKVRDRLVLSLYAPPFIQNTFLLTNKGLLDEISLWQNQKKEVLESYIYNTQDQIKKYEKYLEQTKQCCICLDEYGTKSHVIVCKNGHSLCVGCFNNPTLDACPLCRQEIQINKVAICNICSAQSADLKLMHCPECAAHSVVCSGCTVYACCKRSITNTASEECKKNWGMSFLQNIDQKEKFGFQKILREFYEKRDAAKKELQKRLKYIGTKLEEINREFHQIKPMQVRLKEEYEHRKNLSDWMQGTYSFSFGQLVANHNTMVDRLDTLRRFENEYRQEAQGFINTFKQESVEDGRLYANRAREFEENNTQKKNKLKNLLGEHLFEQIRQEIADQEAQAIFEQHPQSMARIANLFALLMGSELNG